MQHIDELVMDYDEKQIRHYGKIPKQTIFLFDLLLQFVNLSNRKNLFPKKKTQNKKPKDKKIT